MTDAERLEAVVNAAALLVEVIDAAPDRALDAVDGQGLVILDSDAADVTLRDRDATVHIRFG